MQTYVNKFNVALSQDKSEAILDFSQNTPLIPGDSESGGPMGTNITPVANLVMTGACARQLAVTLLALLDQEAPE